MSAFANAKSKRIMIVDDSRALQAIIRRSLECEGLGDLLFQTANDGADANDKVASFKPDLVLSDWHMPGVSGIEMLQAFRQTSHTDVAVGFITTDRAADCRTQARRNGALFFLNKPFDDRTLRSAVAQGLGRCSFKPPETPARLGARTQAVQAIKSLAQIQQTLFAHLGMRGFELTRADEQGGPFVQQSPQLTAIYGSPGREGVCAVGLLDLDAGVFISEMAAASSPQEIRTSRLWRAPSSKQIEQATRFIRSITALLKKALPQRRSGTERSRHQHVALNKLTSLIDANSGRSDFLQRVNSLGIQGDARRSFLLAYETWSTCTQHRRHHRHRRHNSADWLYWALLAGPLTRQLSREILRMRTSAVLKSSLLLLALAIGALATLGTARADFELTDKKGRRILLKDNGTWRVLETRDGAASAPQAAEEPKIEDMIELQLLRRFDAPGGCRLDLSLANNLPYAINNLVPDFIALRANGAVYGNALTSFAAVKPGESRSRSIQLAGIACTEIAKLQVSGADRCEMGALNKFTESKGKCLTAIKVLPSDLLKFEK